MLKQILISLVITLVVSSVLGYALCVIFGGWLNAFVFSFLLQLVGYYFYNDNKIKTERMQREVLLNERYDILSRNLVTFDCPCGNNTFEEIVYPGVDNTFECEKCEQQVKVEVTFTPIVVTKPLTVDPLQKIQNLVDKE